jgi:hypothetical protein
MRECQPQPAREEGAAGLVPKGPPPNIDATSYKRQFSIVADRLRQNLPHLKNVLRPSRYQLSRVSVYDYSADMVCTRHLANQQLNFAAKEAALEAEAFISSLRHDIVQNCRSRLIVVEDVCQDLLQLLSVTFVLSPEVCEEHLVQSGWAKRYTDPEPQTWKSRRVAREHVSLRWYRPGRVSLAAIKETSIDLSPDHVLCHDRENVSTDSRGTPIGYQNINIYPDTNVWRRYLDFRRLGSGALAEDDLIAREERVTVWKRHEDDFLYGMATPVRCILARWS